MVKTLTSRTITWHLQYFVSHLSACINIPRCLLIVSSCVLRLSSHSPVIQRWDQYTSLLLICLPQDQTSGIAVGFFLHTITLIWKQFPPDPVTFRSFFNNHFIVMKLHKMSKHSWWEKYEVTGFLHYSYSVILLMFEIKKKSQNIDFVQNFFLWTNINIDIMRNHSFSGGSELFWCNSTVVLFVFDPSLEETFPVQL